MFSRFERNRFYTEPDPLAPFPTTPTIYDSEATVLTTPIPPPPPDYSSEERQDSGDFYHDPEASAPDNAIDYETGAQIGTDSEDGIYDGSEEVDPPVYYKAVDPHPESIHVPGWQFNRIFSE